MENNLIYALYCPIHNKPVYIGQTTLGMKRPFDHIKEKSHSIKVNNWIKDLRHQGLEPIVVILEHSFESAYIDEKEQFWINKHLNKGCLLFNQTLISPAYYQATEFDVYNSDFLHEIRMFIKGRRKLLKITQKELADKAGVGIRFLRELEQGTKLNFNTASIQKVLMSIGNVRLSIVNAS